MDPISYKIKLYRFLFFKAMLRIFYYSNELIHIKSTLVGF